jgi:hypothetical protein
MGAAKPESTNGKEHQKIMVTTQRGVSLPLTGKQVILEFAIPYFRALGRVTQARSTASCSRVHGSRLVVSIRQQHCAIVGYCDQATLLHIQV